MLREHDTAADIKFFLSFYLWIGSMRQAGWSGRDGPEYPLGLPPPVHRPVFALPAPALAQIRTRRALLDVCQCHMVRRKAGPRAGGRPLGAAPTEPFRMENSSGVIRVQALPWADVWHALCRQGETAMLGMFGGMPARVGLHTVPGAFYKGRGGNLHMVKRVVLSLVIALGFTLPQVVRAAGAMPAFSHIYVIMEENTDYEDVIGNTADAPYINSLAQQYSVAANYYGVTHPSEPNYLAVTAGDFFGLHADDQTKRYAAQNIVDQLEAKGLIWATYQQGLPAIGSTVDQFPATGSGLYVRKHNPFMLYTDVLNSPARLQHVRPIESLTTDLNTNNAPNYAFIAPDTCHDMHGVSSSTAKKYGMPWCAYPPNFVLNHALIQAGDAYVRQLVTTIMSSKSWTADSVIALTWDENESSGLSAPNRGYASNTGCCASPANDGGGRVPFILVTSTPQHIVSLRPYNHYSLLRTIEENWDLGCLANTCNSAVQPMTDLLTPAAAGLPLDRAQGFAVTFTSTNAGQGSVYFGPTCGSLVEVATRDLSAGTTTHTVLVQGNDLPGTVGDIGLTPGATYAYEVVTATRSGTEIDNNGGQCYYVTISMP